MSDLKDLKIKFLWARFMVDFDDIEEYVKYLDKILKEEQSGFYDRARELAKNSNRLEEDEQRLFIAEDYYFNSFFPTYLSHSTFNTAYSVFEKYMNEICFSCEGRLSTRIKLKDLNGKGIERSKLYLSKVVGIDTPFTTSEWNDIKKYSELRNVLIHTLGELNMSKNNHKKVYEYCSSNTHIYLSPDDPEAKKIDVILSLGIIDEAILCYRAFLGNLHKETCNKILG